MAFKLVTIQIGRAFVTNAVWLHIQICENLMIKSSESEYYKLSHPEPCLYAINEITLSFNT